MALTDIKIRKVKSSEKPYKLSDEKRLFLLIAPNGSKYWRFKYRFDGKEKLLALGVYPDISLLEARTKRDKARGLLANGIDPSVVNKTSKQLKDSVLYNTFQDIACEWYAKHIDVWSSNHKFKIFRLLEKDIFPWIGKRQISEITAPELLAVLR